MSFLSALTKSIIVVFGLFLVSRLLEPSVSKNEPFLLRAKLPLFGHILGMLRDGNAYLQGIS